MNTQICHNFCQKMHENETRIGMPVGCVPHAKFYHISLYPPKLVNPKGGRGGGGG